MERNLLRKGVVIGILMIISTTLLAQQFEKLPVVNSESQRTSRNQLQRMPVRSEAQPVSPGTTAIPQQRTLTILSGGSDVLVNNNNGASGTANFTQSETSVIAFGNNIVIGYNDAGSNAGGANKFTGWSYSNNNGASFIDGGTLPTNAAGDAGDPVLARNENTGRIYFATLGFTNGNVIQIFRSDDNGVTWFPPVNGTPGGVSEDKCWLTVDNNDGIGGGNVYLMSRRFGGAQGIYFYRSIDNGNTWSAGNLIVSNMQGAFVVVGPDHTIYAFWFNGSTIMVRKSTDLGLTFGAPVTVASGLVGGVNGNLNLTGIRQGTAVATTFRTNEFPHAFVNPVSGHVYVTYNNDGIGADKADVFMVMSTNAGATWSAPVKINDDLTTTDQWMPTIAVTPDGLNVGVFYYSRQEDPVNNNLYRYYARIGSIVGSVVTFAPSFAVSDVASLPEFGRDNVVNPVYMGDYNQVAATPNTFHVVWSDNRDDLSGGAPRKDPNVYYDQISLAPPVDPTVFYSKAAGNLHDLTTWGVNPDGSGTNPSDFGAGKTFNLANRAGIYAMTASWTVEGQIVNPFGSQLQINGFNLTEAGMSGGGSITGSPASTLRIIGSAGGDAGPMTFTPGGQTLNHFQLNRTGPGAMASLITPLEIYGSLGLTNGVFATNDRLTLNSDAAGTAMVLQLGPSGGISGNVTVERYIPARRAWRILTAPILGGQTIFQSWQENRNNTMPDPNPFPGFGTHITGGPVFGSPANGFDQNPGAASSIKNYNSATDSWIPLTNTNATAPGMNSLMVFIRGDRGIALGPNNVPPVPTTLRAKGPLFTGGVSFVVNASGFTALGNPYASPVDFALMSKTNVQNSLWIWDPKMGGLNGVGAYVNVSFNGTTWDVTPASVSPISQIIQSGQGFLVKSTGVIGILGVTESNKSATPAQDVFRTTKTTGLRVSLLGLNDDQSTDLLDEFFSSYAATYASKIDQFDVSKAGNIEENLAIENGNDLLMLERRPALAKEDQIMMKIWNLKEKNYVLELNPENLGSSGITAWLVDEYTQTVTPIALDKITKHNFTVGKNAASADPSRFSIIISEKKPQPKQNLLTGIRVYPNPVVNNTINLQFNNQDAGSYEVRLLNSIGQVVFSRKLQYDGGLSTQKLKLDHYPKGMYQLEISGEGRKNSYSLLVAGN